MFFFEIYGMLVAPWKKILKEMLGFHIHIVFQFFPLIPDFHLTDQWLESSTSSRAWFYPGANGLQHACQVFALSACVSHQGLRNASKFIES